MSEELNDSSGTLRTDKNVGSLTVPFSFAVIRSLKRSQTWKMFCVPLCAFSAVPLARRLRRNNPIASTHQRRKI